MSPTPRRHVALAALAVVLAAWPSLAGAATAAPTWQAARVAALPSGAKGLPQGYLPTLACPTTGNCVAAGIYADASGKPQGLLLTELNGQWSPPVTIRPPSDAATAPGTTPNASACGAVGSCTVVGAYQLASGDTQPFIVDDVGGQWRAAFRPSLPSDALTTGQTAQLRAVACSSLGNCTAVGTYDTSATIPTLSGFAVSEVNGTWGNSTEISAPAGANVNPFLVVSQVSCASNGDCSVIGTYLDNQNVQHGVVVNEVGGVWQPAEPVTPPANASLYAHVTLSALTCTGPGSCTAVGTYYDHAGATQVFATHEVGGVWSAGLPVAMPTNAGVNPKAFFYGYVDLACASATTCSAGGQYRNRSGLYEGFIVDEVGGVWQRAVELTLPTAGSAGKNGGVVALSCVSVGNCRAGAAYLDAAGRYQAAVASQVNGVWHAATKITLPGHASSVGVDGGVYALICHADNRCVATGSYLANATEYQGFTVATA